MPVSSGLLLLRLHRELMVAHAVREAPNECCGLLLGRGGTIERVIPMKSDQPAPDAYFMNPLQQLEVFTGMEKRGEELLGIYHSHPKGPAEPSGADLQMAFHPEAAYVIISLADPDRPELRAFKLSKSGFEEIPVTLAA